MSDNKLFFIIITLIIISGIISYKIVIEEIEKRTMFNQYEEVLDMLDQFPDDGNMVDPCTLEVIECAEEIPITIEQYIRQEAERAGIYPQLAVDIAFCESRLDPYAKNPLSSAKGIYQFTDPTWEWIKASGHQYDQYENVDQFMKYYPIYPSWWSECLSTL